MVNLKLQTYFSVCLILFLFSSCIEKLNTTQDGEILYHPALSLPIGSQGYTLGQIMPEDALGSPLSSGEITDTTPIISYNDLFFNDPMGYDTVFILPFDFSIIADQADEVVSLMFRANYISSLPTTTLLQVYFMDTNLQIIDSLYYSELFTLLPAELDEEGLPETPTPGQNDTYLNREQIENCLASGAIGLHLYMATNRNDLDYVKFFSDYPVDFQFAVRAQLNIPMGQ